MVLLFPGQGSQYIGMGSKWIENYPYAKEFFERADEALGFSIKNICLNGPDSELVKTEYTQPAILTVSVLMYEIFKREKGGNISFVAGHSLGEYSALVAAGALKFEEAVKIVNLRGKLMQKAVPAGLGKMAALRKCDINLLKSKIDKVLSENEIVAAANYNSDDQIVVSGSASGVDRLLDLLKEEKIRAIPLNVSAPFHSPLMSSIVPEFKEALEKLHVSDPIIPYIANVDANLYKDKKEIVNNLAKQIPGSVLWVQTIKKLKTLGAVNGIEVGPGKVLTGLCSKIEGGISCFSMDENMGDVDGLRA